MSQNNSILFITSFRDIGRDKWTSYKRDVSEYVNRFNRLIENMRYPVVAYVDIQTMPLIRPSEYLTVVDRTVTATFFERYEAIEEAIMSSDSYKSMIPAARKNNPEHLYAAYNLATHSKINYIRHAMQSYPEYTHYSWIDFGCVTNDLTIIPYNIDLTKMDANRIMTQHLMKPERPGRSPQEMLTTFDIYVMTGMFIIPKGLVEKYEELYDRELQHWHSIGVCDDDQSLIYQVMLKHPEMFNSLPSDGRWSILFKMYLNGPTVVPQLSTSSCKELFPIMLKHGSSRSESLCGLYETLLKYKRDSITNVFELGIGTLNTSIKCSGGTPGGCLRAWKEYLPNARVYGADIDRESLIQEERVVTMYVNKLNSTHKLDGIQNVQFDLMIDDAGGSFESSVRFLETVIGRLSRNGLYVIEGISEGEKGLYETKTTELGSKYPYNFVVQGQVLIALPRF